MNTLGKNKKMITLLVIVFICVLGTIIVGMVSNDKVNASGSTPVCPICTTSANMQYTGASDSGHTYVCSQHGQSKTEAHAYDTSGKCTLCGYQTHVHDWTVASRNKKDANKHYVRWICNTCSDTKTTQESHTFNSSGTCPLCGYSKESTESTCEHTYEIEEATSMSSGHTKKCTKCGKTYTEACTLTDTDHDTQKHYVRCRVCGVRWSQPHFYNGATYITETYHKRVCEATSTISQCDYFYLEEHTWSQVGEWVPNGNKTHSRQLTCPECTGTKQENANCTAAPGTTICADCGANLSSGGGDPGGDPPQCEHTYVTKSDETNHWEECSKCGKEKANSKEEHKGATHANDGKCTVCNYQYQTHGQATTVKEYTKTATGHTPVYACTYEGCTETYNGAAENHTLGQYTDNENGTHSATCTICSYELTAEHTYEEGICSECGAKESSENETCEHSYVVKSDNTNHWEECSKCGQVKTGTLDVHTYGTYTDNKNGTHSATCSICNYKLTAEHNYQNQTCSECGAKESSENETCEHSYVVKSNKTNHWEECSKCGQVKTETLNIHTYGTYTDNKNGTHSAICSICNYKLTAEHNYQNQTCSECGAKESSENETCEHSYVVKSNKTNHWEECTKCGQVKTGTLEEHTFTNYVDNKDGTHTATCSKCSYKLTEEHQTDGNCQDCSNNSEQKPGEDNNNDNQDDNNNQNNSNNQNNNNQNNNGDKTDNTVVDKDIPYTGIKSVGFIAIFALGVVGIISAVKMKKYKDM